MVGNQARNKQQFIALLTIVVAILLAYGKIFSAGINNWDDEAYVFRNEDIMSFSFDHITRWFTRFYIGNYHPLTMLSYALDWLIGRQDPFYFHLTNILLHTGSALVLYAVTKRLFGDLRIAFFTALIFAIHPVQTESVSWIAERKNVLYGFFYLLAVFCYISYQLEHKRLWLYALWGLGLCAMLSKPAGISLPVTLIAIDIWMLKGMKDKSLWIQKIPLFILALVLGWVGIVAQKHGGFLNWHEHTGVLQQTILAGYAYSSYIFTFLLPVQLSVWYPYPSTIGFVEVVGACASVLIALAGIYAYRKKWHVLAGGILFFSCNIFLVLQFVQFGESLRADRYLYIPCIGIIIPAVYYAYSWFAKKGRVILPGILFSGLCIAMCAATFVRNDIWMSELNFWSAVLKRFPESSVAQYSMGAAYLNTGDYTNAGNYIDKAVTSDPRNYKAWYDKGVLELRRNNIPSALDALNRALALHEYPKALFTRALLYQQTGSPEMALNDVNKFLLVEPGNARALYIKGDCLEQLQDVSGALEYYSSAIANEGGEPLFYLRRGLAYAKVKQFQNALNDLDQAIGLRQGEGEYWYWRGLVKYRAGQSPCKDLHEAANRNFESAKTALVNLCK